MKFIHKLLSEDKDPEYLNAARDFTRRHFIKKNRLLIQAHYAQEDKKFDNVWRELNKILWKKQHKR